MVWGGEDLEEEVHSQGKGVRQSASKAIPFPKEEKIYLLAGESKQMKMWSIEEKQNEPKILSINHYKYKIFLKCCDVTRGKSIFFERI